MPSMKPMLARVPDELHARVKQEAEKRNVSMTKVITEALEIYLNSVFLAAHLDDESGGVIFSIRNSELEKLRSIDDWEIRLQIREGVVEDGGEGVS